MANQETVIGLLFSVKESIKLDITEYEWPKDYKLNYFDFAVSFEHEGHKLIGRGVDKTESLAIEKAASEAIERLICYTNNINSVGLSVGIGYDCDEHSKFEALERYYLNEHVSKKIKLSKHNISASDLINDFVKKNNQVKINFFKMLTPKDTFGIICILYQGENRSIGFSYSNDERTAFEKSFIESLPNLAEILKNKYKDENKPWHLKGEFIDQIELLENSENEIKLYLVKNPALEKVKINLDKISFLSGSKLRAVKYIVKDVAE
jgi:hypothetical protein